MSEYKYNVSRNKKLTHFKRQNLKMANQLDKYMRSAKLDAETLILGANLVKSLRYCASTSLYSWDGSKIELISFLACGHKLCNVCNWDRQKKIRRKYLNWFKRNEFLHYISKNGKLKVTTNDQLQKYINSGWVEMAATRYNIMHLMLSVPHTVDGWRGQRFYYREIVSQFNFLRKKSEWLNYVYGGQFGLETTRNDNGYHIHIHALLFVRPERQNRNTLHRIILYWWNRLTVDDTKSRPAFTDDEIKAIKKGNCTIDDDFIKSLNPKGATFIHLQNIYAVQQLPDGQTVKHHVEAGEWDTSKFIAAVLETISYLYKPKIFAVTDNTFDCEAIMDILPKVYNNRSLYSKFGCLIGEKALNVTDNSLLEDLAETGEIAANVENQKEYFITNCSNTYSTDTDIRMKRNNTGANVLPCTCASEAVALLRNKILQ